MFPFYIRAVVKEETFVKKFGIKIIFTTHSPSTIALCPDNSIFQLTNGLDTSLKNITKDGALKILTGFIPTLSIDYKSHRQIFVESPTDIRYYQNLYSRHNQARPLPHKLYFISNSYGKSNCEQVYKIVREIRSSGNKTSFGLVDWDLRNTDDAYTYVHGRNLRYSVENYLLDPIFVLIILIDTGNAYGILGEMGLDQTYNQYLIGEESEEKLQGWVELFFQKVEEKYPALKYASEQIEVKYLNGKTLSVPKWYLHEQGHNLVDKLKIILQNIVMRGQYN